MFKHQGNTRTLKHNLRMATLLSFVAGLVNVTGFLAFKQLTTNVTGHFALFIYDLAHFNFWKGLIYFAYIFSFFLGSFSSSILIETFKKTKTPNIFVIPVVVESIILIFIPLFSGNTEVDFSNFIVCLLLFAMGLQNSYVTKISNAVVRTTHLTGLFTDLGIEISQLFFPNTNYSRSKLKETIKLRLFIILFFFSGGLVGGYFYSELNLRLKTLILGSVLLVLSIFYNVIRYRIIKTKRKYKTTK